MKTRIPQILIPLLGGLAIAVGRLAADRWPPLPAKSVPDWLPWFAVAAAVVGALNAAVPRPWLTWPARILIFGAIAWLTVNGLVPHTLDPGSAVGWTVAVAALALLAAGGLDAADHREDAGPAATIAPAAALGFAGLVSILSEMVLDMLPLLGAMAIILLAALLGLRWRAIRLGPGGHTFAIAMLAALLTLVAFFASDSPPKAIPALVLISPGAAMLALLTPLRDRAWRGLIAIAIAMLAALLTLVAFFASDSPPKPIPAVVLISPAAAMLALLSPLRDRAWRGLIAAVIAVSIIGGVAVAPLAFDEFAPEPDPPAQNDSGGYDYGL